MIQYKNLILIVLLLSSIESISAQTLEKVRVSNSIQMSQNIEKVWSTVSSLKNLDKVVPNIVSETEQEGIGKGSIVTLTLKANGLKVIEEVLKLNHRKRIFIYRMIETPMPIENYKAKIRIRTLSDSDYEIYFDAVFKVAVEDKAKMIQAINSFQKTLLDNIKKLYNNE